MKKKYIRILFTITFLLVFISFTNAQCNINTFTLTAVNGSCAQDTKVNIAIPGGTTCGTATATIRLQGTTTDLDFKALSASGNTTFENLKPGTYQVRIQQGATTTVYKNVTTTSSYTPISVTATPRNTSCGITDPLYQNNGEISVNFSGGNGPYTVTLTGPGGPYTFTTNTPTSHTFTNLAPGNYIATVTDNSSTCTSAEARSATITDTGWLPLTYSNGRRQLTNNCETYFRLEFLDGNKQATLLPGNATYTISGDSTVYNLISLGIPSTGRYTFRTAYGLPANKDITVTITDGCRVITKVFNTRDVDESWEVRQLKTLTNQSCETVFSFQYKIWDVDTSNNFYYWHFSSGVRAAFYAEVPVNSNNWVLIEDNVQNTNYYGVAGWTEYQTTYTNTRIKVVFTDINGCNSYERIVDGRGVPNDNNLNKVVLGEISGVLAGTSTISVNKNNASNWSGTDSFSYPMTFSITRKDGQTNMSINASQPYNLSGIYNITFPYIKTYNTPPTDYWNGNRPIFGDLPLGEYVVTITDGCGYSVTREINLTKPAGYTPSITYNVGCAASDVNYSMGVNANTQNLGRVYVYRNNNGTRGTLVAGYNPNQILSGTFPSISPGEYFLVFKNINYYPKLTTVLPYDSPEYTNSVARNTSGADQEYQIAFTVAPYQQMAFSTTALFCDPSNANSGILAITTTGIPVGRITYSIWKNNLNPNTDTPTQTYTTTNLTELEHVFTGLSAGGYFVRVINDCGFTEQQINMVPGTNVYPDPVGVPNKICTPGDDVNLAIAIPNSLFDIKWYDANNTLVGTGNSIIVNPLVTTIYTVKYSLLPALGCTTTAINQASLTVEVGNCFCYKPAATTGTTLDTKHGITALGRAGADNDNWPMVRKGAWTVLEANTKGFAINRISTTAQVNAIANPVEGMMVYDEEVDCLKVYTSTNGGSTFAWHCLNQQTCPDY